MFKISSKKLELQYKIIKAEPFLSFINKERKKKEKRQVIDFSNYLDDLEEENERIREDKLKKKRNAGIALKNIPNGFLITINRLKFLQLKTFLLNLVGKSSYFVEININGEIRDQKNKIIDKKNIRYIISELKKLVYAYKQSAYGSHI